MPPPHLARRHLALHVAAGKAFGVEQRHAQPLLAERQAHGLAVIHQHARRQALLRSENDVSGGRHRKAGVRVGERGGGGAGAEPAHARARPHDTRHVCAAQAQHKHSTSTALRSAAPHLEQLHLGGVGLAVGQDALRGLAVAGAQLLGTDLWGGREGGGA